MEIQAAEALECCKLSLMRYSDGNAEIQNEDSKVCVLEVSEENESVLKIGIEDICVCFVHVLRLCEKLNLKVVD